MSWFYPKWLRELLTEVDGQTVDAKRVLAIGGSGAFFYFQFHSVVINHSPFDPLSFASGVAAIVAGLGAAINLGRAGEKPPNG